MTGEAPDPRPEPAAAATPAETPLDHGETVARAVISSRLVNKQGVLKPELFEPKDGTVSVTRLRGVEEAATWRSCQHVVDQLNGPGKPVRTLYGRADVSCGRVADSGPGMSTVAASRSHNPAHAHIVGWPKDKAEELLIRTAIAAASVFSAAPAPPAVSSNPAQG